MGSRLDVITDWEWERIARETGYQVRQLADAMVVCPRRLQSYFLQRFHCGPKVWLAHLRVVQAKRFLAEGKCVKEFASALGFSSPGSFRIFFKRITGETVCSFSKRMRAAPRCLPTKPALPDLTAFRWVAPDSGVGPSTVAWTNAPPTDFQEHHSSCRQPGSADHHTPKLESVPMFTHLQDCSSAALPLRNDSHG